MIILSIRTDKPESEIGLFNGDIRLVYETWEAHRRLSETLHSKLETLLKTQQLDWSDINGIIAYSGPGSFTGLRIGISTANALAYAVGIPIVGTSSEHWLEAGISALNKGENDMPVIPEYGSAPHITQPKK